MSYLFILLNLLHIQDPLFSEEELYKILLRNITFSLQNFWGEFNYIQWKYKSDILEKPGAAALPCKSSVSLMADGGTEATDA